MQATGARIAVVGAGMAGAACSRLFTEAGMTVSLFDKSRGVGGRMSTRRAEWAADDGALHRARFDHGAPGFTAQSPEFIRVLEKFAAQGLLSTWVPRITPCTVTTEPAWWVPTPDMPALCRALCTGLELRTECTIDALVRGPEGWSLSSAGAFVGSGFDAVIIAIPPRQAAPLLAPHQTEWSQCAQGLMMLPAWVLMGITEHTDPAWPCWDLARPSSGVIDLLIRNDTKPGRDRFSGRVHWVAHATASWSQEHLEAPAIEVQGALQKAVADLIDGSPMKWLYTAVHRWRYASAAATPSKSGMVTPFWWDANLGLGVCGDALSGPGVEGAWCSAQALTHCVLAHARPAASACG